MEPSDLIALVHAAGFSQALLLALYFWKTRERPGNIYESLLLLVIAISIGFGYLYGSHAILDYPHLARFGFTVLAMIGPLLYLSVRARDRADNRLQRVDLWLWLVPLGITLYLAPFHLSPAAHKLQYLQEDLREIHFDCVVILYCALINNIIAITLSIARMHRATARIFRQTRAHASPAEAVHRGNSWFHGVPLAVVLAVGLVSALDPNLLNSGLFSGVASLVIFARSYLLLFPANGETGDTVYPPAARYQKALLSEDFVKTQGARIRTYLDEEQPHAEPDFQLGDIARHLGLSNVQTSQIINRHFEKSFLRLVQSERVDIACELLLARPASSTILEIALESGFNSKSAFNNAFKKLTGRTLGDWRHDKAKLHQPVSPSSR